MIEDFVFGLVLVLSVKIIFINLYVYLFLKKYFNQTKLISSIIIGLLLFYLVIIQFVVWQKILIMSNLYFAFFLIIISRRLRCLEIAIKRKRNIVGEIVAILLLALFAYYIATISKTLKSN